jgi:hypothetical protein
VFEKLVNESNQLGEPEWLRRYYDKT